MKMHFIFFLHILFLMELTPISYQHLLQDQNNNPSLMNTQELIIHPSALPVKGAIIEDYRKELIMIKLKTPDEIMKDALSTLDFSRMPEGKYHEFLLNMREIENNANMKYDWIIELLTEFLPISTPVENQDPSLPISLGNSHRLKRTPLRAFLTLLRIARPLARVAPSAGKVGRYAKFLKGVKYTGYAASAAVVSYEIADAFGIVPDQKYEELRYQLNLLQNQQTDDLLLISNLTLATLTAHEDVKSKVSKLRTILLESSSNSEMYLRSTTVLNNYLDHLQAALSLLYQGKLSSFFLSLDQQRDWLEKKLPHPLLNYIGSITPHLNIEFVGFDFKTNAIILTVELPKLNSQFQILNFVQWEPRINHINLCFSSPKPYIYLAYSQLNKIENGVVKNPYILDPQSCLNNGFILCEVDSLIEKIPQFKKDSICVMHRKKRELTIPSPFLQNHDVVSYNLSELFQNSIEQVVNINFAQNSQDRGELVSQQLRTIHETIESRYQSRKKEMEELERRLDETERNNQNQKITLIVLVTILFLIPVIYKTGSIIFKKIKNRSSDQEQKQIEELRQMRI